MKRIKIIAICLVLLMVLTTMVACERAPFPYEFRQDRENVEKVEICSFDYDNGKTITPLVKLEKQDADLLMSDIQALDCYELMWYFDVIMSYGDTIICITYQNEEVEVIGPYNIGHISPDGKWSMSNFYFEIVDVFAVIAKYVDADLLMKTSEHFRYLTDQGLI